MGVQLDTDAFQATPVSAADGGPADRGHRTFRPLTGIAPGRGRHPFDEKRDHAASRMRWSMYWRGIPHFDSDEFATARLPGKRNTQDNALLTVLAELVKYLAITAAIYLFLVMALSVL
jgi:hypothetical protein